ncbi:MAG: alkaline phosphatase family protein [Tidjanibacter sp.]|nr:alkaline phosphatase family protein [Tidjanibacter sp.]
MKKLYSLGMVALVATLLVACGGNPNGRGSDQEEKYVVILSMDAFRHDLCDLYDTPTLDSIASVGVFSKVAPCFPSNTFPNHYSMATGLHPDHHGIVNNSFYDKSLGLSYSIGDNEARVNPDFYKGEPIWNTVERQGLTAHVYTWVGVEAPINNHFPTKYLIYDSRRTRRELADHVLGALCNPNVEEIPNLTMWYFDEPDAVEHSYSPTSDETKAVVEDIDNVLAYFMSEVRKSPVYEKINFIFTADHGMTELNPEKYYNVYDLIPGEAKYYYNSNPLTIEPVAGKLESVYNTLKAHEEEGHYRVWMREDMPEEYHYGTYTDRIYPIVLLADTGWKVVYNKEADKGRPKPKASSHGYDPFHPDMHMAFFACGPAFKSGYVHEKTFQNLNDHLIIAHILGIEPAENNDCVWEDVEGLFRSK